MSRQKRLSLLLHPLRRELYTVLCENPGSYLLDLVKILESPPGTITWHLRMLEKDGLVKSVKFAGKRLYFPKMLRSGEAEKAFSVLRSATSRRIFSYVINHLGCHQEQIAQALGMHHDTIQWHTSRMVQAGLIRTEQDGRKKKHYLDWLGEALIQGGVNTITEAYIRFLMDKLQDGCLNPEIVEKTPEKVTILIDCPDKRRRCHITIRLVEWDFQEIPQDEDNSSAESQSA
ncbi:MAG: helix-turn-helix domain-containing protein [Candidatus Thorarchaeota archaeon]